MQEKDIKNKILVIEDDSFDRLALIKMLELKFEKSNLYEASDGQEGFEKYLSIKPNIILTDIRMPKVNGVEMIEKIRKIDKKTPIVVVSAYEKQLFNLQGLDISDYILKPITLLHLYNSVYSCLDEQSQQ